MNEKRDVSDKIEAYCKAHPDYFIRKIHCGAYQGKGLPDLWGCYKGMFICCEAKTDKGRPSKLQEHYIKLINAAGGCAFIARSLEDFIQAVEKGYQKMRKEGDQMKDQWHVLTEADRPEDGQNCFITTVDYDVKTARYMDLQTKTYKGIFFLGEDFSCPCNGDEVLAWMPLVLPEPWEEKQND